VPLRHAAQLAEEHCPDIVDERLGSEGLMQRSCASVSTNYLLDGGGFPDGRHVGTGHPSLTRSLMFLAVSAAKFLNS
jgi:hypothetical protein